MNGISALMQETRQRSFIPGAPPPVRTQQKVDSLEDSPYLPLLPPGTWASSLQNCETYISVIYKLPSLWYGIYYREQPKQINTTVYYNFCSSELPRKNIGVGESLKCSLLNGFGTNTQGPRLYLIRSNMLQFSNFLKEGES